jgi:hypothetical protein
MTLTKSVGVFFCNKKLELRFIGMHINNTSTSVTFTSFVDFEGVSTATIEVWHKPTKTMVSTTTACVKSYSFITMNLPALTPINAVAKNTDELLFRVYNGNVLIWEVLGYWITGTTNIYNTWKQFTTTAPGTPNWKTL